MVQIELTRFRIKKGREQRAEEWMKFLNDHHADTVATMAGEKMYVETVLRKKILMAICTFTGIQFKAKMAMWLKILKAILIKST